MLEKTILKKFLSQLERLEYGSIALTTPDGKTYLFEGCKEHTPKADLIMHRSKMITNLVAKGDIGFAESYRDGDFETNDLTALLTIALKNADVLTDYLYGGLLSNITALMLYYFRANTAKGSKRNIPAHYDLGNDFYSLWLDPTMTYSGAIFDENHQSLLAAQNNKYDRIIQRLEKPSGTLLEIGCGWGGFAQRALGNRDYAIKGITLSEQQHGYATARLKTQANIALEDYRTQTGIYDNIVSIEMFEAVGEKYWPVYFQKMKSLLSNKGKALMQTITIAEPYFEPYRKTGDMVRSFIFPGGMLPSVSKFKAHASQAGLSVVDNFAFGQDYATTLKHWLESFEGNLDKVRALGFNEPFIYLWRFYLAACIASFTVGRTNVIQAEIVHA